MPKCDFNKVTLFVLNLLHVFRTSFYENTYYGGLLLWFFICLSECFIYVFFFENYYFVDFELYISLILVLFTSSSTVTFDTRYYNI